MEMFLGFQKMLLKVQKGIRETGTAKKTGKNRQTRNPQDRLQKSLLNARNFQ